MSNKIKLAVFDMEGTIFKKIPLKRDGNVAPSIWPVLSHCLGPEAVIAEKECLRKWNDGEYAGYVEWMESDIHLYKKYGLTKNKFDEIINSVEYNPG